MKSKNLNNNFWAKENSIRLDLAQGSAIWHSWVVPPFNVQIKNRSGEMTHPVSDQLGWEASQGPSVLDLCWETTLMAASLLPQWGHDDSLTAKITPSTAHHPLIPGNGQIQNIFHPKQEILFWNDSKLLTCHLAANEGLPHVPKDQWESLPLPNSHLEQNLSETLYFLFLLYKATFNLPNTFQPLLKQKWPVKVFPGCMFVNEQLVFVWSWTPPYVRGLQLSGVLSWVFLLLEE